MKKKILIGAVALAVLAALIVLIVFATGGEKTPEKTIDLEGTWMICSSVDAGTTTISDTQFAVFTGDQVTLYQDGQQFFTGAWSIDKSQHIQIPGMDRSYAVNVADPHNVTFYTTDTTFLNLIKVGDTARSFGLADPAELEGTWHIDHRSTDKAVDEVLRFENGTVSLFRNGEETASATGSYQIDDAGRLHADLSPSAFDMLHEGDILYLTDRDTGYVWVLSPVA
ncbi:MAG: hypothetical protein IK095_05390 [Oscillospiraceae bacterium]|nr:hypothetical protein [Oscillospiraceae bacterium]